MIQDRLLPFQELDPHYLDRGIFFGDGAYEVVRSYHGRLFTLEEHLRRLAYSLGELRIAGPPVEVVRERVLRAFAAAGLPEAVVYFHVTRGAAPREHAWRDLPLTPSFFLTVRESPIDWELKNNGVSAITHPDWRWKRCDIKSLNLLPNVLAKQAAWEQGAYEALLVDDTGLITEGSSSTLFAIRDGALLTHPSGHDVLPGITSGIVHDLARRIQLPVVECRLSPAAAAAADELFIAVTVQDLIPVVRLDGAPIGNGRPGPFTRRLIDAFAQTVAAAAGISGASPTP